MMEAIINQIYRDNKASAVGKSIICPVCGKIFPKRQYSQAFCSGACKDAFHNANGDRHKGAARKLDPLAMLAELTAAGVMFRIQNLVISGLDENNNVTYRPEVHITLGADGSEKALFQGNDLAAEIERAYNYAKENRLSGRLSKEDGK